MTGFDRGWIGRKVFCDEKNFNLDGPANWRTYSENISGELQHFRNKAQAGGVGLMFWSMLLPNVMLFREKWNTIQFYLGLLCPLSGISWTVFIFSNRTIVVFTLHCRKLSFLKIVEVTSSIGSVLVKEATQFKHHAECLEYVEQFCA